MFTMTLRSEIFRAAASGSLALFSISNLLSRPARLGVRPILEEAMNEDGTRAKVFEDRETSGDWRVEKMDEDGGYEVVKVFTMPSVREQAIRYAEQEFRRV
jgi:hypothetical protein